MTSEATDAQDQGDEDLTENAPLPLNERKLVTQSYDLAVSTLIEQWSDKTLVLPEIQREYVWPNSKASRLIESLLLNVPINSKASRLIESLLLNVPIPVLYLAEAPNDRYEVIDGHQRVASIARYVANEFGLSGLRVLADGDHNRKRFHQLPASDQRRIKTRVIRAIIITDESHPSMKFEVFERLNTGSIALNAQEIRNSTHRGPFMSLTKNLVKDDRFRKLIGQRKPRARMVDNELLIRYFAMRHDADAYKPPLPRFLNNYCAEANTYTSAQLDELSVAFQKAVENLDFVYGENAFRLTDRHGTRLDRSINRALAETQLLTFGAASRQDLHANSGRVRSELGVLHESADFLDDIQRATGDKARTLGRLQQYREAFNRAGVQVN